MREKPANVSHFWRVITPSWMEREGKEGRGMWVEKRCGRRGVVGHCGRKEGLRNVSGGEI